MRKIFSWVEKRKIESPIQYDISINNELQIIHKILGEDYGLFRTIDTKKPNDSKNDPIPWYTYPAIEYLNQLDVSGLKIFEYGCGYSTLYWTHRGAFVWSVDHDPKWHDEIIGKKPKNSKVILLQTEKGTYANSIRQCNETFDIIVIDGVWRNECAIAALPYLKPGGFILLDNSDWYTDVSEYLKSEGFFQIDFNGFGPCNTYCWTTSLLFQYNSPFSTRLAHPKPIGGIEITEKGDLW